MKKAVILGIGVLAVVGFLVFMALKSNQQNPETSTTITRVPTKKTVEKTVILSFSTQTLNLTSTDKAPYTIDLMVDTGSASISGVQAEIEYDPSVISIVSITPVTSSDALFGSTGVNLINDIDEVNGAAVFAVGISANGTQKSGVGKIATIAFNVLSTATPSTQIKLLDTSLVTTLKEKESVLKSAGSATVNIPAGLRVISIPTTTQPISTFSPSPTQ